jgi:hypothetical protein
MTPHRARPGGDVATKVIVVAGEVPWTGVVYTTRQGTRRAYGDHAELLRTIAELAAWPPAPETEQPTP